MRSFLRIETPTVKVLRVELEFASSDIPAEE
jgi:hypothetical protein